MAFIYVITNTVNGKQYVGKTTDSIEKRFKHHLKDSNKTYFQNRPLYRAIKKYGKDSFKIEELEKCSAIDADVKEKYWIEKLNTYHNGYNATLGGDSRLIYDYNKITKLYLKYKSVAKVCDIVGCERTTVRRACKECGVVINLCGYTTKLKNGKRVTAYNKEGKKVKTFDDMTEAGKWLIEIGKTTSSPKTASSTIGKSLKGITNKTAYGFIWKQEENL